MPSKPLLVRLLAKRMHEVGVGGVETEDVRVLREHRGHHRREVGSREIEEHGVENFDPVRLERRQIGRHRGPPQCVVLRADHRGLEIRHLLGEPPHAGDVVDGVHLAGRDQGRGIRREVARQQGGDQHPGLVGDGLDRRPGVSAQHHDELDVILEDELGGARAGLLGRVLVVIADELESAGLAPDLNAAGRVHLLRPDLAAVQAREPPRRDLSGQGRKESDLDGLGGGGSGRGHQAARESCAGRGRTEEGAPAYPLLQEMFRHRPSPRHYVVGVLFAPSANAPCRDPGSGTRPPSGCAGHAGSQSTIRRTTTYRTAFASVC